MKLSFWQKRPFKVFVFAISCLLTTTILFQNCANHHLDNEEIQQILASTDQSATNFSEGIYYYPDQENGGIVVLTCAWAQVEPQAVAGPCSEVPFTCTIRTDGQMATRSCALPTTVAIICSCN